MTLTISIAGADDVHTVVAMWDRSASWLHGIGSDQWQYPVKVHNITRAVDNRECWLVRDGEIIVATVTLNSFADPLLWHAEEHPEDALYVHRLVVDHDHRGRDIGSAVLDWAGTQAEAAHRSWLRLDAWRTNHALHKYYLRRGFELVRIVDSDPSGSGACFQRPSTVRLGHGSSIVSTVG